MQKLTDASVGLPLSRDYIQSVIKEIGPNVDLDDPKVDADIFEKGIKKQFGDLKKNFRGVVDNIRTEDYNVFLKVNAPKAKQN